MDQKPRQRDKATEKEFDEFYFEYCERPEGSVRQTNHFVMYIAVLYNFYKLTIKATAEENAVMNVREFCNHLGSYRHMLWKKRSGHLCIRPIRIKSEHSELLAEAIKAANAYEKEQGRDYDYSWNAKHHKSKRAKKDKLDKQPEQSQQGKPTKEENKPKRKPHFKGNNSTPTSGRGRTGAPKKKRY